MPHRFPVAISPGRLWLNGPETEALARPTPLGCATDSSVVDALLSRQACAVDAFADASVSFADIQLRLDAHKHRLRW